MAKDIIKNNGRIYTPDFIVNNILDLSGYYGDFLLEKSVIDNSCGDGAFLVEIVKRYCTSFIIKNGNLKNKELKSDLEKYIHGIEIDIEETKKCVSRLSKEAKKFGLDEINWDIICGDTLTIDRFNGKMDFVVGNPPYVRVHNLAESYNEVKKFSFCENGMTDLYIVFFEIGFKMLNKEGKMCLITPSSCLKSKAGKIFREYILNKNNLSAIVDLEHFQPFDATTYTMITLLENNKINKTIEYYKYDTENKKPKKEEILNYDDLFIDGKIFLSKKEDLLLLQDIENYNRKVLNKVPVKNGFATLADSIFIGGLSFENFTINIIKASTGKWLKCFFPYNNFGRPINLDEIKKYTDIYEYLLENKSNLEDRSIEDKSQWHLFGRTQAINDVFKNKIAINTIIKDLNSIRIEFVPSGSGVYSGLYILSDYSVEEIKKIILNENFIKYIRLLKNYKSGGYYTFSSSDLQKFLTYKLRQKNHEQSTIFAGNIGVI